MKAFVAPITLLVCAAFVSAPSARAQSTCQSAQPLTTGTYPLNLHDYFIHANVWDTTYEWFRVTLQPGEQFIADVTNIHVQLGAIGFTDFELWELDPVNCTGLHLADANPLIGSNSVLTTVNHTGAPKDYIGLLYMLSFDDYGSMMLTCNLNVSIAPEPCPGVPDDAFEPNPYLSGTMATPGTYPNLLATSANDDWYRVYVVPGATLTAQITFLNAAGDLDLAVGGNNSNSTSDIEVASAVNISPYSQFVDVHVHAKDGQFSVCNHYDLTLSITNTSIGTNFCVGTPNSTHFGGFLTAQGSTSVSANNIVFVASGLPSTAPALLYDGTSAIQTPFGDGFRCVGGSTHRISTRTASATGIAQYPVNFSFLPPGAAITPGSTWKFQVYYRNLTGLGGTGFNLTNGMSVTFQP